MPKPGQDSEAASQLPEVVVGAISQLKIYQVTEEELTILERGQPDSVLLNFAIFLFSVGLSFLVSLETSKFSSDAMFLTFVAVSFVGLVNGMLLFLLWLSAPFLKYRANPDRRPPSWLGRHPACLNQ